MKQRNYKEYLSHILPCLGYGLLCGAVTGGAIVLFRLAASYLEKLSRFLYATAKTNPLTIALTFAVLVGFALLSAALHKLIPEARGGGIPRSEGILRGLLPLRPLRTLLGTAAGSFLSFFCGLPVGCEGPSVLIGTSIGRLCGAGSGKRAAWSRYVMTGGAGAGFAVATGAPLSAMLFALEEIHKRFTPMLILSVSTSVLSATYVNRLLCELFGMSPSLFHFEALPSFSLSHAGYLLLLGLLIAGAVALFDLAIDAGDRITDRLKKRLPSWVLLIFVYVLTGVAALLLADSVYSGHAVIEGLTENTQTVAMLILLLVLRLLMMVLVSESGATGGIFVPGLAIGALTGALGAKLLLAIGMPPTLYTAAMLIGMCAFMGGTLRAPLTATVLFVELTGALSDLFYVALTVFAVNFITEALNQKPYYEQVLEDMEELHHKGQEPRIVRFEMTVCADSFVVGKAVRDILWPASSVVTGITAAGEDKQDLDHDGERKLNAGDTVILRCRLYDEEEVREYLYTLIGKEHTILTKDAVE